MNKPRHFFDQLQDPTFHDRKSAVWPNASRGRLSFISGKGRGNWESIATAIRQPLCRPTQWFPDANVAFLPETDVVWDALRLAGIGIPGGVAGLTQVALAEMDQWLKLPYRLKDRAARVRDAIQENSWLRTVQKPGFPYGLGIRGYMELLGCRRSLGNPLANGSTFVGTQATDKCTTMNQIEANMGRRALGLAKKGRIDAERTGVVNVSDELHCLIVIVNALLTRKESMILTADADFIEVFAKAAWLFDTHYRGWLAAHLVKSGWYGDPVKTVSDTSGFFNGPLTLFKRPTEGLQEVLPAEYETVRAGVIYVNPRNEIEFLSFGFEPLMLEMLKTRGATNGRCTGLFGPANLHVDLSPLRPGLGCLCLGIGRDQGIQVQSLGHTIFLSMLDLMHCIHTMERFAR